MNFDKTTTAETPLIRIVDDEERMRESLAFMLKHEGFECCVYPTAESFLNLQVVKRSLKAQKRSRHFS
jgi:two-component system response regulator DctR/two-component system response regulator FixJ